MRKVLLALSLAAGLVATTAASAHAAEPAGMTRGQGDAIVVAVWLVWLAAFVAITLGVTSKLKQTSDAPAFRYADGTDDFEVDIRRAA